jgi:hypothetical protein
MSADNMPTAFKRLDVTFKKQDSFVFYVNSVYTYNELLFRHLK